MVGTERDKQGWPSITVYAWSDDHGRPALSFEVPRAGRLNGGRLYRVQVPIPQNADSLASLRSLVLSATGILADRKAAHDAKTRRRMAELEAMSPEQREAEREKKRRERMKKPSVPPTSEQQEKLAEILDRRGLGCFGPSTAALAPRFGVSQDTVFAWVTVLLDKQRRLQEILNEIPSGTRPPTTDMLAAELEVSPAVIRRWRAMIMTARRGPSTANHSVRAMGGGLPGLGKRR